MGFSGSGFIGGTFPHVNADVPYFAKRFRIHRPVVRGNMPDAFFMCDFTVDETRSEPPLGIDFGKVLGILIGNRPQYPVQYSGTYALEGRRFSKRLEQTAITERKRFHDFPVFGKDDVRSSVDVPSEYRIEREILHRSVFESSLDSVEIRTASKTLADADAAIGGFGDEKVGIGGFMVHKYDFTI